MEREVLQVWLERAHIARCYVPWEFITVPIFSFLPSREHIKKLIKLVQLTFKLPFFPHSLNYQQQRDNENFLFCPFFHFPIRKKLSFIHTLNVKVVVVVYGDSRPFEVARNIHTPQDKKQQKSSHSRAEVYFCTPNIKLSSCWTRNENVMYL